MKKPLLLWIQTAMFAAVALALGGLEGLLTPFLPLGIKPGFSNIVTMYCARRLGLLNALFVTLFKGVFALLTRGGVAFAMSMAGGLLSALCTGLLLRREQRRFGTVGIGVLGALVHNAAQLAVAVVLLGKSALALAPMLVLFGVLCGIVTGTVLYFTLNAAERCDQKKRKKALDKVGQIESHLPANQDRKDLN